mmetsp:Transcript_85854/g.166484  ORF Transcript_85854/g.166484 Transcript_85854/m.166484 type:complete len:408 (+) Transcript_85854:202-1425(+)
MEVMFMDWMSSTKVSSVISSMISSMDTATGMMAVHTIFLMPNATSTRLQPSDHLRPSRTTSFLILAKRASKSCSSPHGLISKLHKERWLASFLAKRARAAALASSSFFSFSALSFAAMACRLLGAAAALSSSSSSSSSPKPRSISSSSSFAFSSYLRCTSGQGWEPSAIFRTTSATWAMGRRTCACVSRSRRVTVSLSMVSKSTVMPKGVPTSSARAYLLPIDCPDASTLLVRPAAVRSWAMRWTMGPNFSLVCRGYTLHLVGATLGLNRITTRCSSAGSWLNECSRSAYKMRPMPNDGSMTDGRNFTSCTSLLERTNLTMSCVTTNPPSTAAEPAEDSAASNLVTSSSSSARAESAAITFFCSPLNVFPITFLSGSTVMNSIILGSSSRCAAVIDVLVALACTIRS